MSWPKQFSPQAVRDVEDAVDWLSQSGEQAARSMARAIVSAATRVADRPLIGRTLPGVLPARYRVWSVHGFPYLLIYNAESVPVQVIRVLHTARDVPPLLAGLIDPAGR